MFSKRCHTHKWHAVHVKKPFTSASKWSFNLDGKKQMCRPVLLIIHIHVISGLWRWYVSSLWWKSILKLFPSQWRSVCVSLCACCCMHAKPLLCQNVWVFSTVRAEEKQTKQTKLWNRHAIHLILDHQPPQPAVPSLISTSGGLKLCAVGFILQKKICLNTFHVDNWHSSIRKFTQI